MQARHLPLGERRYWILYITGFSSVEPARNFYYVDDGGQDVLFPFARLSLRLELSRHRVELLYQPIELDTRMALAEPLTVDGLTITFTSANGEQRRSNRDVGPVALLEAMFRQELGGGWFWGAEVAGFYASVKYLSGGDSDVVGAIIDASVRAGYQLSPTVLGFFNVRWIGGGAEGTVRVTLMLGSPHRLGTLLA